MTISSSDGNYDMNGEGGDMIQTSARIARVVNKISHYAEVELIITIQSQEHDIVLDLYYHSDEYEPASSWKEGAKRE